MAFKPGDRVKVTHYLYGNKANGVAACYPGIVQVVQENLILVDWYKWGWDAKDVMRNEPSWQWEWPDIELLKPGEFGWDGKK